MKSSGEICAYCHQTIYEICGCKSSNKDEWEQLKAELTTLKSNCEALTKGLVAAEGLFKRWLMNEINHVFQNTTLQRHTKAFLTPAAKEPNHEE